MGADPLTRQRSPWERQNVLPEQFQQAMAAAGSKVSTYVRRVGDGSLRAIVALEPAGWHASVSFVDHRGEPSRYPTWDELTHFRYDLLPDDLDFVMHLPPPDDYVAVHDTTFHLHQHPEIEQ